MSERLGSNVVESQDEYLQKELEALVEAMVRSYVRRRLRPLLTDFLVLEVEREGQWKLAEVENHVQVLHQFNSSDPVPFCVYCRHRRDSPTLPEFCPSGKEVNELWFMSRLDALLLERSTNSLYLQSYKTAGQWDRRKSQEAEIDMQGLSEAVDVELRLGEAWKHLDVADMGDIHKYIDTLVDTPVLKWLMAQQSPPRVLGVRYEYLLKGQRRQDDKDAQLPGRYVFDSPLVRAYSLDGITSDDRRWGHSYSYWNLAGQNKKLDYRSWKKKPVWKFMPIATWIDRLDAGLVQPEAYDKDGRPMDVLGEQFVAPLTVFRNEDDMRDMLQQLEAEEIRIAQGVAAVRAVQDDPSKYRSALNINFPQNRNACIYPGACAFMKVCYGGSDIRQNPEISGLYTIRKSNHPQEDN